jgi:adenine-specific DNA-methyltransferase
MTRVFIGGSRRVSRLSAEVRARIERIVERDLAVVIGDANGADKAVQQYLKQLGYAHVEVFCSDARPRNNLGNWPVRVVRPAHARRDFDYYATKDRAMASEATVGLMLWDGQSRGTLLNILRLATQGKPTVVHIGPKKAFTEVRTVAQFDELVSDLDPPTVRQLHAKASAEDLAVGTAQLRLQ